MIKYYYGRMKRLERTRIARVMILLDIIMRANENIYLL